MSKEINRCQSVIFWNPVKTTDDLPNSDRYVFICVELIETEERYIFKASIDKTEDEVFIEIEDRYLELNYTCEYGYSENIEEAKYRIIYWAEIVFPGEQDV